MFRPIKQNVFVNLVCDREHIELHAQISNQFQLCPRENFSRGIVGVLTMIAFVCLSNAARNSFSSKLHSPRRSPAHVASQTAAAPRSTPNPERSSHKTVRRSTTSSPTLHTASKVEIIASVDPQQTVTSFSGSTQFPCHTPICRAIALRKFFAPHVIAY